MNKRDKEFYDYFSEKDLSKYLKIGGILTVSFLGVYFIGHIFKIAAHTITGFNQLKNAIKNGN